ncbi:MAG: hypothetical protein AAF958_06705 [Planctomycetota bacterium]
MLCIHCGADDAGKFCPACGRRQTEPPTAAEDAGFELLPETKPGDDWTRSLHFRQLLETPEPRRHIARAVSDAPQRLTAEDLLRVFDAVAPVQVSLTKLTDAILPVVDKLGIATQRSLHLAIDAPPGRVLLASLAGMGFRGIRVHSVQQSVDRCEVSGDVPSTVWTNPGTLTCVVSRTPSITWHATLRIRGQWYDWGKGQNYLDSLARGLIADVTEQMGGQTIPHRVAA